MWRRFTTQSGCPIVGDSLYGNGPGNEAWSSDIAALQQQMISKRVFFPWSHNWNHLLCTWGHDASSCSCLFLCGWQWQGVKCKVSHCIFLHLQYLTMFSWGLRSWFICCVKRLACSNMQQWFDVQGCARHTSAAITNSISHPRLLQSEIEGWWPAISQPVSPIFLCYSFHMQRIAKANTSVKHIGHFPFLLQFLLQFHLLEKSCGHTVVPEALLKCFLREPWFTSVIQPGFSNDVATTPYSARMLEAKFNLDWTRFLSLALMGWTLNLMLHRSMAWEVSAISNARHGHLLQGSAVVPCSCFSNKDTLTRSLRLMEALAVTSQWQVAQNIAELWMLRPGERNCSFTFCSLHLPTFSHNVAEHSWTFYSLIFGLRPEKAVHPTERFCTSSTLFNDVAWLPCWCSWRCFPGHIWGLALPIQCVGSFERETMTRWVGFQCQLVSWWSGVWLCLAGSLLA